MLYNPIRRLIILRSHFVSRHQHANEAAKGLATGLSHTPSFNSTPTLVSDMSTSNAVVINSTKLPTATPTPTTPGSSLPPTPHYSLDPTSTTLHHTKTIRRSPLPLDSQHPTHSTTPRSLHFFSQVKQKSKLG